jgi:hypothetical protein
MMIWRASSRLAETDFNATAVDDRHPCWVGLMKSIKMGTGASRPGVAVRLLNGCCLYRGIV